MKLTSEPFTEPMQRLFLEDLVRKERQLTLVSPISDARTESNCDPHDWKDLCNGWKECNKCGIRIHMSLVTNVESN